MAAYRTSEEPREAVATGLAGPGRRGSSDANAERLPCRMQHPLLTWSESPSFRTPPPAPRAHLAAARTLLDLRALDLGTFRHVRDTARLTVAIARDLGLTADDREHLAHAALMHDLGKLFVDPDLLRSTDVLSSEDVGRIRLHASLGHAYASRVPELAPIADVVRHHHERWDGLGYPDGLVAAATPWDARVVGVADALEAMAKGRSYRPARSPGEAMNELRRCSGSQFDPWIARAASEGAWTRRALLELEVNGSSARR